MTDSSTPNGTTTDAAYLARPVARKSFAYSVRV